MSLSFVVCLIYWCCELHGVCYFVLLLMVLVVMVLCCFGYYLCDFALLSFISWLLGVLV